MAGGPLDLWNRWSIQILVLLSLALQVVLFFFAGIRRREANPVLLFLLWLAYLLADSTAIYALGHLSLGRSSKAHEQQQVVAFWAPFLLLHLGGPDSITAYALQDNELWLRHLQILVVQVLGAAYVLYKHIADNGSFVLLAAILMFALGVVKYGERTWALKRGNMDSIRSSLKKQPLAKHHQFHALDQGRFREGSNGKEDSYVRRAHSMFIICKHAIVDSWIEKESENQIAVDEMLRALDEGCMGMWTLMEVELSLMYDILYTKAAMIHTWSGYCIRVASPLTIVASFLLFQFSAKDGQNRVDVAVTYTLLAGAFLLETTSLLTALGSTWTYAFLCATRWSWLRYAALCTGRWDRLRRLVKTTTARQGGGRARRWSGQMGQYNMLHLCVRRHTGFRPLLGRLMKMVWLKEWWNRKHYSGTVEISDELRQLLFDYIKSLPAEVNSQGVLRENWGKLSLDRRQYQKFYDYLRNNRGVELLDCSVTSLYDYFKKDGDLDQNFYNYFKKNGGLGVELQEGIIIWHIGTDVFLAKSSRAKAKNVAHLVKAIRTLSDYMMFLLVERPYMLPGLAQTRLYKRTCKNLKDMWKKERPSRSRNICAILKELFSLRDGPDSSGLIQRESESDNLAKLLYSKTPGYTQDVPRLVYARIVTTKLLEIEAALNGKMDILEMDILELVLRVWMDFLVYSANRCSRESHAKKLSSGGELTTVLWLMADHLHQHFRSKSQPAEV